MQHFSSVLGTSRIRRVRPAIVDKLIVNFSALRSIVRQTRITKEEKRERREKGRENKGPASHIRPAGRYECPKGVAVRSTVQFSQHMHMLGSVRATIVLDGIAQHETVMAMGNGKGTGTGTGAGLGQLFAMCAALCC